MSFVCCANYLTKRPQIPGGNTTIYDGCTKQYGVDQKVFGENHVGVTSSKACDNLPEGLREPCKWRFEWFQDAQYPTCVQNPYNSRLTFELNSAVQKFDASVAPQSSLSVQTAFATTSKRSQKERYRQQPRFKHLPSPPCWACSLQLSYQHNTSFPLRTHALLYLTLTTRRVLVIHISSAPARLLSHDAPLSSTSAWIHEYPTNIATPITPVEIGLSLSSFPL